MAPPPPMASPDVEQNQVEHSMDQLLGSVSAGPNYSPTIFAQQYDHVAPLVEQIEKVDRDLRNFELPLNEARYDTPPAIIPNLDPPHKVSNPFTTPKEPLHNDSFLSTLAKIDEDLSKLKAVSTTFNDPLNAGILMKEHSGHAINEDAKETARVCQGQGSETHATLRVATPGKQKTQIPQQQGTWKRLNNAGLPSSTDRIESIVDSVLSTKRAYEELSHPNGLPSKKRAVSIEINSTALAEADAQPRPLQ